MACHGGIIVALNSESRMLEERHVSLDPEVYGAGISQALFPFDVSVKVRSPKRVGVNLYVPILERSTYGFNTTEDPAVILYWQKPLNHMVIA